MIREKRAEDRVRSYLSKQQECDYLISREDWVTVLVNL